MIGRINLTGLIAASLVALLPSLVMAQDISFSVSPAVVDIDDLSPGQAEEFQLTISNNDDVTRVFTFTVSMPPEGEARERRTRLPEDSWVTFYPPETTVLAGAKANVTVTIAIPQEKEWTDRKWETWLAVAAESSDLLSVQLYVRLLVSTSGIRLSAGSIAVIVAAVVLLGYGGYRYAGHRARPKCRNPNA